LAIGPCSLEIVVNFWQGKRVFLTGHTGFKGGWLALALQRWGAQVTGFSLPPNTNPNLFELAEVGQGMTSILGDIRDLAQLSLALGAAQPQVVFHLAAQPLVRASYLDPVGTYATNVLGTVHLLEAVRHCPSVRAVVVVTSDKCYENQERIWGYREDEPMGGYDPYSSSKGCAELVVNSYRRSFFSPGQYENHGVALATGRAGNVIGGGDWAEDRLVPDLLGDWINHKIPTLRNPEALRPWQHVLEPLAGYLRLAERLYQSGPTFGGAWNFGPWPQDTRSVGWVAAGLAKAWGPGAAWQHCPDPSRHEASLLSLDSTKARLNLDWEPRLGLTTALAWTVAWVKGWQSGQSVRDLTEQQIKTYFELAR